jgi:hypothetical protein
MIEETDYSEEAKYDLFESVKRESLDMAKCVIARTPPSYDDVKREMEKKDLSLGRGDYEKILKELGFS